MSTLNTNHCLGDGKGAEGADYIQIAEDMKKPRKKGILTRHEYIILAILSRHMRPLRYSDVMHSVTSLRTTTPSARLVTQLDVLQESGCIVRDEEDKCYSITDKGRRVLRVASKLILLLDS